MSNINDLYSDLKRCLKRCLFFLLVWLKEVNELFLCLVVVQLTTTRTILCVRLKNGYFNLFMCPLVRLNKKLVLDHNPTKIRREEKEKVCGLFYGGREEAGFGSTWPKKATPAQPFKPHLTSLHDHTLFLPTPSRSLSPEDGGGHVRSGLGGAPPHHRLLDTPHHTRPPWLLSCRPLQAPGRRVPRGGAADRGADGVRGDRVRGGVKAGGAGGGSGRRGDCQERAVGGGGRRAARVGTPRGRL
jgi:hypothetical protein